MNQTTAHGPALARRSHGVSVPGAPMRATFSDACAGPLAHAALGSHSVHWSSATEGTPIRDARLALAVWQGQYAACDRLHDLSARYLQPCVSYPRKPVTGLF
jgi:hypothetical protein